MSEIIIHSLEDIKRAASEFVALIGNRRIFAFYGHMGAGKTTFIKAICEELGVTDAVSSPTFAIVNEYASTMGSIYHFDFYRIKRSSEVLDLGFEDYAYSGNLCLMEWPELIEEFLPEETVEVHIEEIEGGKRRVTVG
ncbi:MAG: tRNA (adenosine(37)-N6)-threonylcarbamoyltransferase complex ATPase subunit type 1 TsaE [Bacteroidaceae bacterium]|jgi:tRNA threonylcarbamoyladenosine biosynthesis protein TsaE|nr:tRNA (adenosine(37)-N6)-threonylcarbamoyltransferase complex ATPase subunit type 1 TsaE [Bacteroidaceae bacterium]